MCFDDRHDVTLHFASRCGNLSEMLSSRQIKKPRKYSGARLARLRICVRMQTSFARLKTFKHDKYTIPGTRRWCLFAINVGDARGIFFLFPFFRGARSLHLPRCAPTHAKSWSDLARNREILSKMQPIDVHRLKLPQWNVIGAIVIENFPSSRRMSSFGATLIRDARFYIDIKLETLLQHHYSLYESLRDNPARQMCRACFSM